MTQNPTRPGTGYQIVVRPEGFTSVAATFLGHHLETDRESLSIALSGGTTPGPIYEALARDTRPDWDRIDIYFADERVVPLDHPESNYRMVRERLLAHVRIPEARVHPMPVDVPDLEEAADLYARELPPRLDVLILGLGADGHTASLFPGSNAVREERRLVVATTAPEEPKRRLSIAPPVIAAARLVVVLVHGQHKAEAVRSALAARGDVSECPGRLARRGIWLVGRDAAPGLPSESSSASPGNVRR